MGGAGDKDRSVRRDGDARHLAAVQITEVGGVSQGRGAGGLQTVLTHHGVAVLGSRHIERAAVRHDARRPIGGCGAELLGEVD